MGGFGSLWPSKAGVAKMVWVRLVKVDVFVSPFEQVFEPGLFEPLVGRWGQGEMLSFLVLGKGAVLGR